jgi:hypothetical protein
MRAQRIKTGFHRIGLVLAAVCWLPGFYVFAMMVSDVSLPDHVGKNTLASMVFGAVLNALSAGIGWIIAGFMGDD